MKIFVTIANVIKKQVKKVSYMESKKLKRCLVCSAVVVTVLAAPLTGSLVHADNAGEQPAASSSSSDNNSSASQSQVSSSDTSSDPDANSQSSSNTQTHTLSKPYVVYGAGASDQDELNDVLAVNSRFKSLTATANDYKQFINPAGTTSDAAMISSVAIVPTDPGSGIKVNVQKFNGKNVITKVTAQQYAMVAQMAGVTDVTITVSANTPVSGESALTGVYEAIQADGNQLNSQNTQVANQMLDATQSAIQANNGDNSYPSKLMAAVGDATKAINDKRQDGDKLSRSDIEKILNHRLFFRGCYSTTKDHEQPIINALIQFNQAPISKSKDYSSHVDDTIKNVKKNSGQVMNQAKKFANSVQGQQAQQEAQSWFDKLMEWVQGLMK